MGSIPGWGSSTCHVVKIKHNERMEGNAGNSGCFSPCDILTCRGSLSQPSVLLTFFITTVESTLSTLLKFSIKYYRKAHRLTAHSSMKVNIAI